jgi:3-hydroxybutyryl-CoA dehydratase
MMNPGDSLPTLTKPVTREIVRLYAEASGDFNPAHLDDDFAANTQFGRVIAHGMLLLAHVSEMLTQAFGSAWPEGGRLKVRFRAPAYLGDTVTTVGAVSRVVEKEGVSYLECRVGCQNQRGENLITGDASMPASLIDKDPK